MSYSEIGVILLIYTGLFIYFLNPFETIKSISKSINNKRGIKKYGDRDDFSKKFLICSYFILASISIWLGFSEVENHLNAHSGKPLVNMTIKAVYFICGLFLYTIVLYIMLIFDRVLKVVRAYSWKNMFLLLFNNRHRIIFLK